MLRALRTEPSDRAFVRSVGKPIGVPSGAPQGIDSEAHSLVALSFLWEDLPDLAAFGAVGAEMRAVDRVNRLNHF